MMNYLKWLRVVQASFLCPRQRFSLRVEKSLQQFWESCIVLLVTPLASDMVEEDKHLRDPDKRLHGRGKAGLGKDFALRS